MFKDEKCVYLENRSTTTSNTFLPWERGRPSRKSKEMSDQCGEEGAAVVVNRQPEGSLYCADKSDMQPQNPEHVSSSLPKRNREKDAEGFFDIPRDGHWRPKIQSAEPTVMLVAEKCGRQEKVALVESPSILQVGKGNALHTLLNKKSQ